LANELSYIGQASEGRVITKQQITTVNDKITTNGLTMDNNQLFNYQIANYPISRPLFIDFLIAIILAGLGLYIILQLEKKLDIKLF